MKIAILSNVNMDMLLQSVSKKHEVFKTEGHGQWISYALSRNANLVAFEAKMIFLIIDGNALLETCSTYEEGKKEIIRNADYMRKLVSQYPQSIFAVSTIDILNRRLRVGTDFGIEKFWEIDWQRELRAVINERNNVLPFDLNAIIENAGKDKFYSDKMWYLGSIPYGIKSITQLVNSIDEFVAQQQSTRKKVLICDLDNTLWGGVVGEDGPTDIILGESLQGAAYRDAQKRIKEIAQMGVLLAIVSKNNPEDVDVAFEQNSHMVLKKEDFVRIICNWQPKFVNINELSKDLNLGLDSFVFIDDNPVEREEVKIQLPEVSVSEFPNDVANLPKIIEDIYKQYFWCLRLTAEDKVKSELYKQESLRKQDFTAASSLEDYLKSLKICIELSEVKDSQVERTVQLLNKTNQFNTNTRRFNISEFAQYREADGHHVFVANVSDRYGDYGLVVIVMVHQESNTAYIDNFLMSCRVMGRQIEDAIAVAIEERLAADGIATIKSSYLQTAKNKPVEELYERLGFRLIEHCLEEKKYEMKLPADANALLSVQWV